MSDFFFFAAENKLHIPELDLQQEEDILLSDSGMVEKLEQCVLNWQTQITVVLEEVLSKKPQVCDPLLSQTLNPGKSANSTVKEHLKIKSLPSHGM